MDVMVECFNDINSFINTIEDRPNNLAMKGQHSSSENDFHFTQTNSMDEAKNLLHFGFADIVPKIKEQLQKNKYNQKSGVKHPRPLNGMVGYIPNVPNAIQGRIDSMINTEKVIMKKKTLSIVYLIGANCDKDTDYFVKAGTALIAAIQSIEKQGVQVKLQECFFSAEGRQTRTYGIINLKNYGHRFDLKKITFPLAHPSMFRRFGFKWIETLPNFKDTSYSWGYGHAIKDHKKEQSDLSKYVSNDTITINVYQIEQMNFNVDKIIKYLNKKEDA